MKIVMEKEFSVLAFLCSLAFMMVLCGNGCSNENNSCDKNKGECSKEKVSKKVIKKTSKKAVKKSSKYDDDNDSIAFLDDLSSRRARDTELEIQNLVKMIEAENGILNNVDSLDQPYQTVLFDAGSDKLDVDQLGLIDQNKAKAADSVRGGHLLVIRGHSDTVECDFSEEEALSLAKRRAELVKDEFVKFGIPSQQVETVAVGAGEPIVYNFEKDHEDRNVSNRRVEILTV